MIGKLALACPGASGSPTMSSMLAATEAGQEGDGANTGTVKSLLVRVAANASAIQVEGLVNGINSFIKNTQGQVVNLRDQVAQTALASSLIKARSEAD